MFSISIAAILTVALVFGGSFYRDTDVYADKTEAAGYADKLTEMGLLLNPKENYNLDRKIGVTMILKLMGYDQESVLGVACATPINYCYLCHSILLYLLQKHLSMKRYRLHTKLTDGKIVQCLASAVTSSIYIPTLLKHTKPLAGFFYIPVYLPLPGSPVIPS